MLEPAPIAASVVETRVTWRVFPLSSTAVLLALTISPLSGQAQAWVPLINSCMSSGATRSACIAALPPEVLAELEAWEARNGEMRRSQMRLRAQLNQDDVLFGSVTPQLGGPRPPSATPDHGASSSANKPSAMVPILLGWPALTVGLLLAMLGIARSRAWLLLLAAAMVLPMSAYLAAAPAVGWFGLAGPVLLVAAAGAVRLGHSAIAWLVFMPLLAAVGWLVWQVLGD